MSSQLELDSSLSQLATVDSTMTAQAYDGKKRAPVWRYCRRPTVDEDPEYLYCLHCPQVSDDPNVPYGSKQSENMKKHIERKHGIAIEKSFNKTHEAAEKQLLTLYRQVEGTPASNELDTAVLKAQLNKQVITEALVSLIVVRNLSYCFVEWAEVHALCQALNRESKGIIPTTHNTVSTKVSESWARHKDIVRREVQAAISRIHIAVDI